MLFKRKNTECNEIRVRAVDKNAKEATKFGPSLVRCIGTLSFNGF